MNTNNDFFTGSIVTTFADGSDEAEATVVIRNDAIPETNETFTLRIVGLSSGAIGVMNTMQLIISANDQPHGLLQFHMVRENIRILYVKG